VRISHSEMMFMGSLLRVHGRVYGRDFTALKDDYGRTFLKYLYFMLAFRMACKDTQESYRGFLASSGYRTCTL
jgi:hypothetical protein